MVGNGAVGCWFPCFCLSSTEDDDEVRPIDKGALRVVEVDEPPVMP